MGIEGFFVGGIGIKLDGHETRVKLDHGTDLSILNLI
jgi:hypothetical protein